MQRTPVSFFVPTLGRPDFLRRCLRSVAAQTLPPAEVIVGLRVDDELSRPVIEEFSSDLALRAIEAKGVGVVGSMNSCLAESEREFVGFADDDVELPPIWFEKMVHHLQTNPNVLGTAGRDLLQDHPAMRRIEALKSDVGRLHWFGRVTGNHHRGGGKPREVDLLRGSNCLYRGDFLRSVGFDEDLRGQGAQVHWELALALEVRKRGKRLFYDPEIEVIHHVAPRLDADQIHRGRFSYDATVDLAFNETFMILKHASGVFRITGPVWQLLVGLPSSPGAAQFIRGALKSRSLEWAKLLATLNGRYLAWTTFNQCRSRTATSR